MNHRSYQSVNKTVPNMYPNDVPDLVAEQSNRTSIDNSYDALKKVRIALVGGKKRVVKQGSNIKSDNTDEDWYLDYEDDQKLAGEDIMMKRGSFLTYSYCAA